MRRLRGSLRERCDRSVSRHIGYSASTPCNCGTVCPLAEMEYAPSFASVVGDLDRGSPVRAFSPAPWSSASLADFSRRSYGLGIYCLRLDGLKRLGFNQHRAFRSLARQCFLLDPAISVDLIVPAHRLGRLTRPTIL